MTDVFISYKRRMRPKVEQIAAALEALGLDVWFDANLEAGSSFNAEISERVRNANCVLVCWTDDAFAHGGDKNGWVVGEASIGRARGVLVPVLLEKTDLDPPWNTLHTESLIGWSPEAPNQSAWQRVVAAIGKLVGRADLAEAEVRPAETVPVSSPFSQVVVVTLLAAAMSAVGALLVNAVPQIGTAIYLPILIDAALFAIPLAVLMVRSSGLRVLPAIGYIATFPIAMAITLFVCSVTVTPRYTPVTADIAEFFFGVIGGLIGSAFTLGVLPVLKLVSRKRASFVRVAAGTLVLTLAGALLSPAFDFTAANSLVWVAPLWQLAYAPVVVFVLREPRVGG